MIETLDGHTLVVLVSWLLNTATTVVILYAILKGLASKKKPPNK